MVAIETIWSGFFQLVCTHSVQLARYEVMGEYSCRCTLTKPYRCMQSHKQGKRGGWVCPRACGHSGIWKSDRLQTTRLLSVLKTCLIIVKRAVTFHMYRESFSSASGGKQQMVIKIAFNSGACNSAAIYTATRHVDSATSVSQTDWWKYREWMWEWTSQIQ